MWLFKPIVIIAASILSTTVAQAEDYSAEAINTFRYMVEEEKLAGDLYEVFYTQTGLKIFGNIMKSEDQHVAALATQAGLADIDINDLVSLPKGTFLNQDLQSLYDSLLAQGSASSFAALTVGRDIEVRDIADISVAMEVLPATSSLYSTYDNLRTASGNHLNAFNKQLAMYPQPVPEPETYAMMLAGLGLVGSMVRRRKAANRLRRTFA